MKSNRLIASAVVILALGGLSVAQWLRIDELNRQIAQLKTAAAAQAADAEKALADLKKQVDDRKQSLVKMEEQLKAVPDGESAEAAKGRDDAGNAKTSKPDFAGMIKKMFTDPNMKKGMRGMQMMGMKMMYSDLATELGLDADKANQVMEILGDRQMALTAKGMKMLGGDQGGEPAAEAGKEAEAPTEDYDAHLESLLGKDGMEKLKDYEKTMGERMQIQQYKQAFASSGLPLDENESKGLLTIMKEERLKLPASPLDPNAKDVGEAVKAMQSDETFNKLLANQEEMDRRVLSRAGRVFSSPDKMVQFEKIQAQQRELQKAAAEMGRGLFNPK
jgi:hypothetical protein